jgi:hypothetical protein
VKWRLLIEPMHDALIEDAFDKAETKFSGSAVNRSRWSLWVRILRGCAGARRPARNRNPPHHSGTQKKAAGRSRPPPLNDPVCSQRPVKVGRRRSRKPFTPPWHRPSSHVRDAPASHSIWSPGRREGLVEEFFHGTKGKRRPRCQHPRQLRRLGRQLRVGHHPVDKAPLQGLGGRHLAVREHHLRARESRSSGAGSSYGPVGGEAPAV